jgi:hypothetical protein
VTEKFVVAMPTLDEKALPPQFWQPLQWHSAVIAGSPVIEDEDIKLGSNIDVIEKLSCSPEYWKDIFPQAQLPKPGILILFELNSSQIDLCVLKSLTE